MFAIISDYSSLVITNKIAIISDCSSLVKWFRLQYCSKMAAIVSDFSNMTTHWGIQSAKDAIIITIEV